MAEEIHGGGNSSRLRLVKLLTIVQNVNPIHTSTANAFCGKVSHKPDTPKSLPNQIDARVNNVALVKLVNILELDKRAYNTNAKISMAGMGKTS